MSTQVAIEAFVGSTPRLARTNAGAAVASFRAAVNHRQLDVNTGQWVTAGTSWYTVTAYGVLAEQVAEQVVKGSAVVVLGDIKVRDWKNDVREGTTAEITASGIGLNLLFAGSKEPVAQEETLALDTPLFETSDGEPPF